MIALRAELAAFKESVAIVDRRLAAVEKEIVKGGGFIEEHKDFPRILALRRELCVSRAMAEWAEGLIKIVRHAIQKHNVFQ